MLGPLAYALGRLPFHHRVAQLYETASSWRTVRRTYPGIYQNWVTSKTSGQPTHGAQDQWFLGDTKLWDEFVSHVRSRTALEIGSGPYGYLVWEHWISRRIVIDPLVERYRSQQKRMSGESLFTADIETHAIPAERVVTSLVGKIDGAIICRNALDHCEDPFEILNNIADYATSGCYLLLWSDIWHIGGAPIGHRNITRSSHLMDRLLDGLGFDILQNGSTVREPGQVIEYGRLARKR